MENIVFVNGAMNTAFAAGGVASGCLFYFTGLGLEGNMLLIFLAQLFSIPLVTVGVHLSAGSGVCLCTSEASEQDGDDDDDDDDDARMGNVGVEESTPLIGKTGEDTAINADARPDEPEGLKEFLRVTLSSWRYYHTIIIILLKVGIGSTSDEILIFFFAWCRPESLDFCLTFFPFIDILQLFSAARKSFTR